MASKLRLKKFAAEPVAQVYFGSAGVLVNIALTEESRKVLATLYRDPSSGVYACNDRESVYAVQPFVLGNAKAVVLPPKEEPPKEEPPKKEPPKEEPPKEEPAKEEMTIEASDVASLKDLM